MLSTLSCTHRTGCSEETKINLESLPVLTLLEIVKWLASSQPRIDVLPLVDSCASLRVSSVASYEFTRTGFWAGGRPGCHGPAALVAIGKSTEGHTTVATRISQSKTIFLFLKKKVGRTYGRTSNRTKTLTFGHKPDQLFFSKTKILWFTTVTFSGCNRT